MKIRVVATALLGFALAGLAPGRAQTEVAARPTGAHVPQTIVPYLSHGAGVWIERATGRPVSRSGSSPAPATPGVHYTGP